MPSRPLSILFVGETNIVHMIEHKGLDNFQLTRYTEYASIIGAVFQAQGHSFTHVPCHLAHVEFPQDLESLSKFDVVIFSDIGSNTMLLHPDYLSRTTNSLLLTKQYVEAGGAFAMIGGYLSFQGFQATANYAGSHIEDILPVTMSRYDDRVEIPEGLNLTLESAGAEFFSALPTEWPHIFGYNRVEARPDARVLVTSDNGDPVIAIGEYGAGRTLAYTTDCVQDWASPELLEWEHYGAMWDALLQGIARER
ncbi:glutamine amidotransferase [soil metagenome]